MDKTSLNKLIFIVVLMVGIFSIYLLLRFMNLYSEGFTGSGSSVGMVDIAPKQVGYNYLMDINLYNY